MKFDFLEGAVKPVCSIITIASSGTPVRLTVDSSICVNQIFIQPLPTNGNGPYFIGTADLVMASYAGTIYMMPGSTDYFSFPQSQNGMNQLHPSDYYIDSPNSNDKFLVVWWIA